MPKNVQFGGGAPKQEPSVNQKARTDYSLPILGDDDFSGAPRDADPLKTYSLKILRGRTITFLLAAVNILAIAVWMVLSLLGNGTLWWILVYGLGMLACCVFLFFGKETARKFFAIPAVMIGVPVAFSLLINPSGTPMFLKTSHQLAVQIVSAALLYFFPRCPHSSPQVPRPSGAPWITSGKNPLRRPQTDRRKPAATSRKPPEPLTGYVPLQ